MINQKSKRGQIALWVIIGVFIVIGIVFLFIILRGRGGPSLNLGEDTYSDPDAYIERCARDATREAIDIMLPQGGFLEPSNFKIYDNKKIEYLCKNNGNYLPCINQHPMFINELKNEMIKYLEPRVDKCFYDLKVNAEKKGSSVILGTQKIEVMFGPDRVFIEVIRDLKINKNNEVRSFDKFEIEVINPIYDLSLVAIEIASQEAKYCYFEYLGYMILYPRFSIEKTAMSDSTKIYSIEDKKTKKELNIAIRSCAIPPGI